MTQSVGTIEAPQTQAVAQPLFAQVGLCEKHGFPRLTFLRWAQAAVGTDTFPHSACPECCLEAAMSPGAVELKRYFAVLLRERVDEKSLDKFMGNFGPDSSHLEGDDRLYYCVQFAASLLKQDYRRIVGDLLDYKGIRLK